MIMIMIIHGLSIYKTLGIAWKSLEALLPKHRCIVSLQEYAKRKEKMLQLRKQKEEEVFQSKQAVSFTRGNSWLVVWNIFYFPIYWE